MHWNAAQRLVRLALSIAVISAPLAAQCPAPDSFEPNDTCATAAVLTAGTHSMTLLPFESDYYRITVPAYGMIEFENYTVGSATFRLWSGTNCGQFEGFGPVGTAPWIRWAYNTTSAPKDFVLSFEHDFGQEFHCKDYTVNLTVSSSSCVDPVLEDAFYPNQSCATAAALVPGSFQMFMTYAASDFVTISVPAWETLDVMLNGYGEYVEAVLYDDPSCSNVAAVAGTGPITGLQWFNGTAASVDVTLENRVTFAGYCTDYQLDIDVASLAEVLCAGDGTANGGAGPVDCPCGNTGAPGFGCAHSGAAQGTALRVNTAPVLNDANFRFECTPATSQQSVMLLQGTNLIAVPFRDGILCVGGQTDRVQPGTTDAAGLWTSSGDEAAQGNVFTPGATRFYQLWFRDPVPASLCGTGSNLSSAVRITWQ